MAVVLVVVKMLVTFEAVRFESPSATLAMASIVAQPDLETEQVEPPPVASSEEARHSSKDASSAEDDVQPPFVVAVMKFAIDQLLPVAVDTVA